MSEKYYSLLLAKRFTQAGRQIKNIGGKLVVFENGLAQRVDESVMDVARRLDYIDRIMMHETAPVVQPTPEKKEAQKQEPEPVPEEKSATKQASKAKPEVSTPEEKTAPTQETKPTTEEKPKMEDFTKSALQKLYKEKKTWAAVAAEFGISVAALKKYRDSL